MKLPSLLLACCLTLATLLAPPAVSPARAADEVTFDIFYNTLAEDGDWYNTAEFGYVWQPYVAYQNTAWRPYTDGYWAQTDAGWTWVSYENFGWAAYHYGRWTQLENTGWVWVPGYEWGPGWVSWRQNDNYIGWAPIPPRQSGPTESNTRIDASGERVYTPPASAITGVDYGDVEEDYDVGYNAAIDETCDIGPAHYCFVPVRYFGAPYVGEFIVPPTQNLLIVENTVNITNIVYRRGPGNARIIYNGGPDYVVLSRRVEHPIPRFQLERRTDVTVASLRGRGNSPLNIVNGNRLVVTAPVLARRQVNFSQVRPPSVRENFNQVRVLHGWHNSGGDPQTIQRVRAHIQQEARQAPSARTVAERHPAPADFRPDAGPRQNPAAAGGNQLVNPAGRGANTEAERLQRRDEQLRQLNTRREAQGLAPLQPNNPAAGGAANPQTRQEQRVTREQQAQENRQAAQTQRQQAAEQARQQQTQAAEQRRQQQLNATEQRRQQQEAGQQRRQQQEATQQQERRQQTEEQRANRGAERETAAGRQQAAAEAARTRQENRTQEQQQQAASERATRQQEAQGAARERAAAAREQQQSAGQERQRGAAEEARQRQSEAVQERRADSERARSERQQAAGAAEEHQRAAAEARQQQAAQNRAAQGEAQNRAREERAQGQQQQQQQRAERRQQAEQPAREQRQQQPQPQQQQRGEERRERPHRPEGQPTPQG